MTLVRTLTRKLVYDFRFADRRIREHTRRVLEDYAAEGTAMRAGDSPNWTPRPTHRIDAAQACAL